MKGSTPACSAIGNVDRVVILDTGALLAGLQLRLPGRAVATELVIDEVKDEQSLTLLERSIEAQKLMVLSPDPAYIEDAIAYAKSAGTAGRLSRADLSVIGMALELRGCGKEVVIATDDYAVQLTAVAAGLPVIPVRYPGVREARRRTPSGQSR